MRPALSVILFTTLSGAGFGLLAWLGLSIALLHARPDTLLATQLAVTEGWRVVRRSGDLELLEAPAGWPSGG